MQSYIGILAREKVRISYKSWKQVPSGVKDLIWESVNLSYNVDPRWKKGCLNSANSKWRQYKALLTHKFIFSKLAKPEELKEPPIGYGITRDDWSAFVISRMSDDFKKVSDEQKKRRKQNVYPHRLARKGYARFADEIGDELCDDEEINRAIIWKKGRMNKKGQFEGDDLKMAIEKIDDYVQQKREGKLHLEEANTDILSKALSSEEHSGRVRGVGGYVTPTFYFNVGSIVQKHLVDEQFILQQKELMEAKILISQQNARISNQDERIQKLEAMFRKGACDLDTDEKGSCSVKLHPMSDENIKIEKCVPNIETLDDDDMQILNNDDFFQVYI
ncbi:uncharacterized protein LOC121987418 [Zingiber officinale]|uniref:uncharacterized protein LOC121987418 n=1 Tax=Zingiber officinale TaxID=94328 RepID=UPI001C4C2275|nr:uncharacterized protein LOC121987418 [Zingiber officinale]